MKLFTLKVICFGFDICAAIREMPLSLQQPVLNTFMCLEGLLWSERDLAALWSKCITLVSDGHCKPLCFSS